MIRSLGFFSRQLPILTAGFLFFLIEKVEADNHHPDEVGESIAGVVFGLGLILKALPWCMNQCCRSNEGPQPVNTPPVTITPDREVEIEMTTIADRRLITTPHSDDRDSHSIDVQDNSTNARI